MCAICFRDHSLDCLLSLAAVSRCLTSECRDEPHSFRSTLLEFVAQELILCEEVEHGFEVVVSFRGRRIPFLK